MEHNSSHQSTGVGKPFRTPFIYRLKKLHFLVRQFRQKCVNHYWNAT
jgi:hypothetical protein